MEEGAKEKRKKKEIQRGRKKLLGVMNTYIILMTVMFHGCIWQAYQLYILNMSLLYVNFTSITALNHKSNLNKFDISVVRLTIFTAIKCQTSIHKDHLKCEKINWRRQSKVYS